MKQKPRKNQTLQSARKLNLTSPPHVLPSSSIDQPFRLAFCGDARDVTKLTDAGAHGPKGIPHKSVDLVVTSPPYWKKRDYGFKEQIGQESTPEKYVDHILSALKSWRRVLRPTGSIFINIGDTYWHKSLQAIPSLIEAAARAEGWKVRNRIAWVKKSGMPDPAKDRLASRHEYVIHLALSGYYYDLFGYAEKYSVDLRGANPGDVWELNSELELGGHLAPFPTEIRDISPEKPSCALCLGRVKNS
jgi:DNA modification methylase